MGFSISEVLTLYFRNNKDDLPPKYHKLTALLAATATALCVK
jgi:hypothetical protein